jgi:hypothetical protein
VAIDNLKRSPSTSRIKRLTTHIRAKLIDSILLIAILASVLLAAIAVLGSGIYTTAYGIRLSSQTLWRPTLVASVAGAFLLYRSELRQQNLARIWCGILRHYTAGAIILAAAAVAIGLGSSAFEAYGADAYGYVSQAHLWAAGDLVQHEPLALRVPWPEAEWTFSPLGYRPGLNRGTIAPTYPPGLPLFMAGFLLLFGQDGPFFVVPLFGGVAIAAAFLLGRRVAGEACGLATAVLLLTDSVFLFHLKEPLSDVPATAWWLLAMLLASTPTPWLIFLAGLAASAAIVTRPNLVPLAAILGMCVLFYSAKEWRPRLFNAFLFSAAVVPGCLAIGVINAKLYGSPLLSGYGDTSVLFSTRYFRTNVAQYSRWLLDVETPFVLLAPLGWFFLKRREASCEDRRFGVQGKFSNVIIMFVAGLFACYATYVPFDNWTFLRFLLPAIALLLLLCGLTVVELAERLRSFFPRYLLAACFVVFLAWRWDAMGLKPLQPHARRSAVIGEYVQDHLPPNAVVLSLFHAGSIRYYSGRLTLRWDWLPPEWLDRSVEFLESNGYQPFLLIGEDWERTQFVQKFSGHSKFGSLSLTPIATYHQGLRADLYDLGRPIQPSSTAEIRPRPSRHSDTQR